MQPEKIIDSVGMYHNDTREAAFIDLIADALILAEQENLDAQAILRMGIGHFEEETYKKDSLFNLRKEKFINKSPIHGKLEELFTFLAASGMKHIELDLKEKQGAGQYRYGNENIYIDFHRYEDQKWQARVFHTESS